MNDGGPAFPRSAQLSNPDDPQFKYGAPGMSLRDYFAAAALTGALGESGCDVIKDVAAEQGISTEQAIAELAYRIADQMLEVRKRR